MFDKFLQTICKSRDEVIVDKKALLDLFSELAAPASLLSCYRGLMEENPGLYLVFPYEKIREAQENILKVREKIIEIRFSHFKGVEIDEK